MFVARQAFPATIGSATLAFAAYRLAVAMAGRGARSCHLGYCRPSGRWREWQRQRQRQWWRGGLGGDRCGTAAEFPEGVPRRRFAPHDESRGRCGCSSSSGKRPSSSLVIRIVLEDGSSSSSSSFSSSPSSSSSSSLLAGFEDLVRGWRYDRFVLLPLFRRGLLRRQVRRARRALHPR